MAESSLLVELKKELNEIKTKTITKWPRPPVPAKCPAGTAVISDRNGNGVQVVEARNIMFGDSASFCMPLDGVERGQMLFGSHLHQVSSGETLVLQFTPYPKTREYDGMPCVCRSIGAGLFDEGRAWYPNTGMNAAAYREVDGTFYYNNHPAGIAMYDKAMAEKAEPVVAPVAAQDRAKGAIA